MHMRYMVDSDQTFHETWDSHSRDMIEETVVNSPGFDGEVRNVFYGKPENKVGTSTVSDVSRKY